MLYDSQHLDELEAYINAGDDKELLKWWAQYCESKGQFDKAGYSGKVLFIDGDAVNDSFRLAAGNLPGINVLPAMGANVYDILKHDTLVLTKDAVEKLEARFNG